MSKPIPATVEVNPPGKKADAVVIWLHGLGADGHDFVPIVEHFNFQEDNSVRFVFPHAPIRPITVNDGMEMRGWYDIATLDFSEDEDVEGILASEKLIRHLIERELEQGVHANRIVLAGFSQGGAMALHVGLRFEQTLGGIIALSSYLPLANRLADEYHSSNRSTPIFMAHGLFDPVVPLAMGQQSERCLSSFNYPVKWHTYPMPHAVLPEEISDIGQYLQTTLALNPGSVAQGNG